MKKKVLVAGSYAPEVKTVLETLMAERYDLTFVSEQEELKQHPETEYLIQRILRMEAPELEAMPNLKFIQRWGAGYDTVDIQTAGKRNVVVANAAGVNAPAVAEQTVNLILSCLRNTSYIDREMRSGKWIKSLVDGRSYMIRGKTVGLIGAGNIGKTVASILQGFGADIQYTDAYRLPLEEEKERNFRHVSFEDLLKTSDIISIHIPLSDSSYHMIGKEQLAMMKPTAIIVNTARGGIIDEKALYEALKDNRILAAGIDCFESEPVESTNPLLTLDNVTCSCHVGGNTADIGIEMAKTVSANITAFEEGRLDERYIVNKAYLI